MRTRAWRRAQNARIKNNRKNYWWWSWEDPKSPRHLGILLNTPKPCSCHMCGNPRKYFEEKPINQLRQEQYDKEVDHALALVKGAKHEQNLPSSRR